MVLDVAQFLAQNIDQQMRISHFDCDLYCGKPSKLKAAARSAITAQYGESYLEDAQYLIIMSGDQIQLPDANEKLFGILDRSLGKIANNLNRSDIKSVKSDMTDEDEVEGKEEDEVDSIPQNTIKFKFLKITVK